MSDAVTGVILAGGTSSRMGENKALVSIAGRPAIAHVHALLSAVFPSVCVMTNHPEEFAFLGIPLYRDCFSNAGPLAGVHAALVEAQTEAIFVTACDLPLMSEEMVRYLAGYPTRHPITLASAGGFIHHLFGLYSRACIPQAERMLRDAARAPYEGRGRTKHACSLQSLSRSLGAEIIDAEALPFYSPDLFYNMNSPEDLAYVRERLRRRVEN